MTDLRQLQNAMNHADVGGISEALGFASEPTIAEGINEVCRKWEALYEKAKWERDILLEALRKAAQTNNEIERCDIAIEALEKISE